MGRAPLRIVILEFVRLNDCVQCVGRSIMRDCHIHDSGEVLDLRLLAVPGEGVRGLSN